MTNPFETFFSRIATIHASGAGTAETSYYGALQEALNEIGAHLKPKVHCIGQLKERGAGHPDFGLYAHGQLRKAKLADALPPDLPERGAIEMKPVGDDIEAILKSKQVADYLRHYGILLVTNLRSFVLLGRNGSGRPVAHERFDFGLDPAGFFALAHGRRGADAALKTRFVEFLQRVLLYRAPLADPRDVAWFLASYARDGLAQIEGSDLPALAAVRTALEQALGLKFEGEKGDHFFRSTLIQTLFYGVFSAWVIWCREQPPGPAARFDWHAAGWSLHVPMIRTLFEQVATPTRLKPLGLVEVLDWTAAALNRVDRAAFFERFEEKLAVQYFYEPFLEAFDPDLRKQLGVWYTPPEIVTYMVERVDRVLRADLGLADGLADPNVYVLDPCCGTGSYLVEVLGRIEKTLTEQGRGDALLGESLKRAAMTRVYGFEILPAPFVIAHWQVGALLHRHGAVFDDAAGERAGVYLTNALTGWEPPKEPKTALMFPELEQERDAAEHVKRDVPILVILGNPPYNAFAGTSPDEEQGLVEPYKDGLISKWGIKKFNLDDLYVRFFRIAERRIAEKTGRGIVCYISNFSYLGGPAFVVARERFRRQFDKIWIDCMNGDSRETGKLTPDGQPDPSVFSTDFNREGIRVGTAVALMVRSKGGPAKVAFRHFWGVDKRTDLLESLSDPSFEKSYRKAVPAADNRFSFRPSRVSGAYLTWPRLTELCAIPPYNGPVERRGFALISIDREPLARRMKAYFDATVSDEAVRSLHPSLMMTGNRIVGPEARQKLLNETKFNSSAIVRYPFKPFDVRWSYLANIRPLFSEPSPDLIQQREIAGNAFLISRDTADKAQEGFPFYFSSRIVDYDCLSGHARHFPTMARPPSPKPRDDHHDDLIGYEDVTQRANLSVNSRKYLATIRIGNPDKDIDVALLIWLHALAVGYSSAYLKENADGVRQDWPRIPLPATAARLRESARLGAEVARLLDSESPVPGVTSGTIRPGLRTIAVISRVGGGKLAAKDLLVRAGWGHAGKEGVTMPGKGKVVERDFAPDEALDKTIAAALDGKTSDIYLNDDAYWRNVPARVWDYTIGGYQVMKKWLSYREHELLGRALTPDEAQDVTAMARRLAALVLLEAELDTNYRAVAADTFDFASVVR